MNKQSTVNMPKLEVVESKTNRIQVEFEIERHIKQIRSLIGKLHPVERQKYFDGFLTHLITPRSTPQTGSFQSTNSNQFNVDLSSLSDDELGMIRELAVKMDEMYREIGDVN